MKCLEVIVPNLEGLWSYCPFIEFQGRYDQLFTVLVTYMPQSYVFRETVAATMEPKPAKLVEMRFGNVVEFRIVSEDEMYTDFPEIEVPSLPNIARGIVEVVDSPYIEHMINRMGAGRFNAWYSRLRHFVLSFDHYGELNIVAVEFSYREYDREMTLQEYNDSPFSS